MDRGADRCGRLMKAWEDSHTGLYYCIVTNFDSSYPGPRKYCYRACCFPRGKLMICGKSIEGHSKICVHPNFNPLEAGKHRWIFCFECFLFDFRHGAHPLRATVFDSARKLVDFSPEHFARLDKSSQLQILHTTTKSNPIMKVWIRSDKEKRCIVQKFEKVVSFDSPPRTPPTQYYTMEAEQKLTSSHSARATQANVVGTSSSSTKTPMTASELRTKLGLDEGNTEDLQRSLVCALDFLHILDSVDK